MAYLVYDTKKEADNRSRDEWLSVLGREKLPEDVTEFLWSRLILEDLTIAVLVPDEDVWMLSSEEQSAAISDVVEVTTPAPIPPDQQVR